MSAFHHALSLKAKPGRLNDARAEIARLSSLAEANGATARLMVPITGDHQRRCARG